GAELGAAVDLGRLDQVVGDAVLEVVADDDHVAHRHAAGQEQGPHIVDEARLLDHQVGGHQAAAKVHGKDEEQADPFAAGQAAHRQGVGGDVQHHHREDGADDGVLDGVEVAGEDVAVRKDQIGRSHV